MGATSRNFEIFKSIINLPGFNSNEISLSCLFCAILKIKYFYLSHKETLQWLESPFGQRIYLYSILVPCKVLILHSASHDSSLFYLGRKSPWETFPQTIINKESLLILWLFQVSRSVKMNFWVQKIWQSLDFQKNLIFFSRWGITLFLIFLGWRINLILFFFTTIAIYEKIFVKKCKQIFLYFPPSPKRTFSK